MVQAPPLIVNSFCLMIMFGSLPYFEGAMRRSIYLIIAANDAAQKKSTWLFTCTGDAGVRTHNVSK
ncbi:hypothetical protein St703_02350 [Sporolactobacillus terrae]|uniref:Uncharacterized protein n=1 Tax=Sporolactobacillus terrae TaxID=269673 RepID=A0A5K7WYJ2_9BACL|nr:hypothetical protein St703_02350 [Sporolactobacillus terrae]